MPKIQYGNYRVSAAKALVIKRVNEIVEEYRAQGFTLTLRQVYYQFVSRGWIDNKMKEYKRLGVIIGDGRMAGEIDWTALEDRTREMGGNSHWNSPQDIINSCAHSYKIDKWQDQKYRPEVWVEKDALEGVIGTVCRRLDIPFFSCRGYASLTSIWDSAQRLRKFLEAGQEPVILHMGDHDPSGLDMTRDINERLNTFLAQDRYDRGVTKNAGTIIVKRIALNMDQVKRYNPPPNPAKTTDMRYAKYEKEFGDESWELDALEPSVLAALIETEVKALRNNNRYVGMQKRESLERGFLEKTAARWDEVADFLE